MKTISLIISFLILTIGTDAAADEGTVEILAAEFDGLSTLWILLAAFLVFFMQAGFGMVEAGLIRAKNVSNILMKNLMDFCFASLGFFIVGYGLMYGGDGPLIGTSGWFLLDAKSPVDGVPMSSESSTCTTSFGGP